MWNLWWVYYALIELRSSPLECEIIFFPWGCDLRYHTLSLTNGLLALPVTAVWGPVVSYNLLFVLWTMLTGWFAAMWAREFGLSLVSSTAIGLLAAVGPFRWSHQDHLNIFSTGWLFLAFWVCERALAPGQTMKKCSRLWVVFTLVWLLAVFSDWYFGFYIGIYFGFRMLAGAAFDFSFSKLAQRLVTTLLIGGFVLGTVILYMSREFHSSFQETMIDPVSIQFSAYWSLDLLHLVLPMWLVNYFPNLQRGAEFAHHPGLGLTAVLVPAAVYAMVAGWKQRKLLILLGLACLFTLLSLGPVLMWNGEVVRVFRFPVFLPTALMELVPSLTIIRVYSRFAYVGSIAFCAVGFLGLDRIADLWPRRWLTIAGAVLTPLFFIETYWHPPVMNVYTPPPLIVSKPSYPVFEAPYTPSKFSGLYMYHQTIHQQPILVAEFSRLTKYKEKYLRAFPVLETLNKISLGEQRFTTMPPQEKDRFFDSWFTIGHFVINLTSHDPTNREQIFNEFNEVLKEYKIRRKNRIDQPFSD